MDKGQYGWVHLGSSVSIVSQSKVQSSLIIRLSSRLQKGPGTEFAIIKNLLPHEIVFPIWFSGEYVKVKLYNGYEGWTLLQDVKSIALKSHNNIFPKYRFSFNGKMLANKTIVIDPGHGGKDTGEIGILQPIYERNVNLSVAKVLQQKLIASGANVIMTRTHNNQTVSLQKRVAISIKNKADAFISIHQNIVSRKSINIWNYDILLL